ncbi:hypothetical protein LQZ24_03810 [Fructobacillus sp. M1-13]|uniref:Lipoprotein n=1 Tax=Fructobacillus papyriferae TaxID=2713171 RepID=A0ABS5QRR0_9LACO|nr:hypothetical protein [Fructobacillus papyriferae]MBS9335180.1 hypothetical protein [Fructobacillus papyriferae]MCD2159151.1 hypothetical protein [Fructobacillus papyriferae]
MRNSKTITRLIFISIVVVLFGALLTNYIGKQMSKSSAKRYVPQGGKAPGKISTKNNPAKEFALTGPSTKKNVKELGFKSGFYDIHLEGGNSQYWDGASSVKDEYGHLLTDYEPMNLEKGKKLTFTPAKFSPLSRQGESYVITNPGTYLPETQIPTGQYRVTYEGKLTPQSATPNSKAGSMLMVNLLTYDQQTIPESSESDHYNVTLYKGDAGRDAPADGLLSIEKDRLVHVTMSFVSDPQVKIILTPVNGAE